LQSIWQPEEPPRQGRGGDVAASFEKIHSLCNLVRMC
jgi:hypothetical protein